MGVYSPERRTVEKWKQRTPQITGMQAFAKRACDILLSICALVVSCLPILIFAAIIFAQDGHWPIYSQRRLTKGGREFSLFKLRTMIRDAERDTGPVLASGNDPRITAAGRFLRRTGLDELPQFWNVLKGDMSVVGPRPERRHFSELYSHDVPQFPLRLEVRAGITGMAHIYGQYDTPPEERIKLDLWYISNYSLALDFKIMIKTVKIMFFRA